ncbi:MAG TPA: hypothetical protein VGR87_04010 [Candidatus Limnocylindria bacterium]|jgi:hypothetical protein|nr:hypothetical protein [Candidatus Limnocylindria bacterium]
MEHPPPFWAARALAEFVRERASWRRTKAKQFPDDERNLTSADALEELASYVEKLPDTDRDLIELIELDAFDDRDRFIASHEARRATARWGHDSDSFMRPRDVIRDLVAITRRARRKPARERTSPMTITAAAAPMTEYLEAVLMHARACSRRVSASSDAIFEAAGQKEVRSHHKAVSLSSQEVSHLFSAIVEHENTVGDFIAGIAPAAVDQARRVGAIAPGYLGDLRNLEPAEVDALVRPIFEAADITGDFIPWQERFPDLAPSDEVAPDQA